MKQMIVDVAGFHVPVEVHANTISYGSGIVKHWLVNEGFDRSEISEYIDNLSSHYFLSDAECKNVLRNFLSEEDCASYAQWFMDDIVPSVFELAESVPEGTKLKIVKTGRIIQEHKTTKGVYSLNSVWRASRHLFSNKCDWEQKSPAFWENEQRQEIKHIARALDSKRNAMTYFKFSNKEKNVADALVTVEATHDIFAHPKLVYEYAKFVHFQMSDMIVSTFNDDMEDGQLPVTVNAKDEDWHDIRLRASNTFNVFKQECVNRGASVIPAIGEMYPVLFGSSRNNLRKQIGALDKPFRDQLDKEHLIAIMANESLASYSVVKNDCYGQAEINNEVRRAAYAVRDFIGNNNL